MILKMCHLVITLMRYFYLNTTDSIFNPIMLKFYVLLAVASAVSVSANSLEFTNSIDGSTCKLNQRYSDCVSACPLTCEKKNLAPEDCPWSCSPGCECLPGYYLNQSLECVRPENCEHKQSLNCGKNQQFSFCRSPCPETCGKKAISPCPFECTSGCECLDGYVLTRKKECVKPLECSQ